MKLFKDKTFKIALRISTGLLFLILIFLILEYHRAGIFLKNRNWELESQNRRYRERLQECKKYPLFEQVISGIDIGEYDLENYNCVDFSKDLVKRLEEIGIKSNIAINKDRTHAWVIIWVEATSGRFIRPDNDLGILELRDKEMNVICK